MVDTNENDSESSVMPCFNSYICYKPSAFKEQTFGFPTHQLRTNDLDDVMLSGRLYNHTCKFLNDQQTKIITHAKHLP